MMPGEKRSCIGCHEMRRQAPRPQQEHPMALNDKPAIISPQPGDTGPYMVHYERDVQPIFDRNCVSCHSGKTPKGDLDLSGTLTMLWNRSYESLTQKDLVSFLYGRAAADVRFASEQTHPAHSQGPVQIEDHPRGVHQDRHLDRRQCPILRHARGKEEHQVERQSRLQARAAGR
jgi:hypothetical protein